MRFFLLPISTRRTLIYCQKPAPLHPADLTLLDKGTARAAKLWASWEAKESGWQKKVAVWGNEALKRIPYEEWGLKSIPPRKQKDVQEQMVEVSFPGSIIPKEGVNEVLRLLGTERMGLHRKRMIYCFIGMPISAPIALIPVIPNLPFFYLVYRAWSHWRALSGSKHIQFLLQHSLIAPKPSSMLDKIYASGSPFQANLTAPTDANASGYGTESERASQNETGDEQRAGNWGREVMLLNKEIGIQIANALEFPELHVELERAIWQVEKHLREEEDAAKQKDESDKESSR